MNFKKSCNNFVVFICKPTEVSFQANNLYSRTVFALIEIRPAFNYYASRFDFQAHGIIPNLTGRYITLLSNRGRLDHCAMFGREGEIKGIQGDSKGNQKKIIQGQSNDWTKKIDTNN